MTISVIAINHIQKNHFHRALKQYGKDKFTLEIICECHVDDLTIQENYWIDYWNALDRNKGYNKIWSGKTIIDNRHKIQHEFLHIATNEIYVGTQNDFVVKYNLTRGAISLLINKKYKQTQGWVLID